MHSLHPQLEAEFAEKWQSGQVAGWEDRGEGGGAAAAAADGSSGALDLDAFDSADELEMLGEAGAGYLLVLRVGSPGVSQCGWVVLGPRPASRLLALSFPFKRAARSMPARGLVSPPRFLLVPLLPPGAERLKEALAALGLKCGGTLRQRAERLMQAKGKKLEELDRSLFAKGAAPAVSLVRLPPAALGIFVGCMAG